MTLESYLQPRHYMRKSEMHPARMLVNEAHGSYMTSTASFRNVPTGAIVNIGQFPTTTDHDTTAVQYGVVKMSRSSILHLCLILLENKAILGVAPLFFNCRSTIFVTEDNRNKLK